VQIANSFHILLDAKLQVQGDLKGLSAFSFLFEILKSCKVSWMGKERDRKNESHIWQEEVLKHSYHSCALCRLGPYLPVLAPILATQIHYLND
jgi:hypothetical protein